MGKLPFTSSFTASLALFPCLAPESDWSVRMLIGVVCAVQTSVCVVAGAEVGKCRIAEYSFPLPQLNDVP